MKKNRTIIVTGGTGRFGKILQQQNFKHYEALLLFIQNKTENSNKFCMIKQ